MGGWLDVFFGGEARLAVWVGLGCYLGRRPWFPSPHQPLQPEEEESHQPNPSRFAAREDSRGAGGWVGGEFPTNPNGPPPPATDIKWLASVVKRD